MNREVVLLHGRLAGHELAYRALELLSKGVSDSEQWSATRVLLEGVVKEKLEQYEDSEDYKDAVRLMIDTFESALDRLDNIRRIGPSVKVTASAR